MTVVVLVVGVVERVSDSLAECWGQGRRPLDFILFQVLFLKRVKRLLWMERKGKKKKKKKVSYAGTGHGVNSSPVFRHFILLSYGIGFSMYIGDWSLLYVHDRIISM